MRKFRLQGSDPQGQPVELWYRTDEGAALAERKLTTMGYRDLRRDALWVDGEESGCWGRPPAW